MWILLPAALAVGAFLYLTVDRWPEVKADSGYALLVREAVQSYGDASFDASRYFAQHSHRSDYLNYGKTKDFRDGGNVRFDPLGVPLVRYGSTFHYNPVTVSQFALSEYGKHLAGDPAAQERMLAAGNALLDMQDPGGAFRYDFAWKYYLSGETYAPGWVSGMAQGQAISALIRVYLVTDDAKYLDASERAFDFLLTPKDRGGTRTTLADFSRSLGDHDFFTEYTATPDGYTLNGYMFTLLGLSDLLGYYEEAGIPAEAVESHFSEGIETLKRLLPYYDLGGFSAYDLGHYTYDKEPHVAPNYHMVHIALLHALFSVTGEEKLRQYEELWSSYVE